MRTKRYGCAAVVLEGVLMVIGGHDGHRHLNTVETYDPVRRYAPHPSACHFVILLIPDSVGNLFSDPAGFIISGRFGQ